ncbi:MAG TPA: LuxR C-terminal-related transcriptional regulator [Steroidobacteraceae bacterium]|nr:LuxR C-terminal-related transcriptional regulator [Steroidobacteraceae bacterium]
MHTHEAGAQRYDSFTTRKTQAAVFIVHADSSLRETMEKTLRTDGLVVESFSTAEEFLSSPRASLPSCVILDISAPQLDAFTLHEIIAARAATPFIFITAVPDTRLERRALQAGAVSVLSTPLNAPEVLDAVRSALDRSRIGLAHLTAMSLLQARYAALSHRESEVLNLVVSGLLNKQIAAELGISEITVKAHRGKMMRKMRASSVPELVNMAARLGPTATIDRTTPAWRWTAMRDSLTSDAWKPATAMSM